MDLEMLARMVDELVRVPAADRVDARLYGVRLFDDDEKEDGDGDGGGRVLLDELGRGEAREIPRRVRPPAGLAAIALTTTGWAAPTNEDGTCAGSPSRHPRRRRIHVTALIGGDGEDVSVLRYGDGEAQVVRGAIGVVHERLLRCWRRRTDAPPDIRRGSVPFVGVRLARGR